MSSERIRIVGAVIESGSDFCGRCQHVYKEEGECRCRIFSSKALPLGAGGFPFRHALCIKSEIMCKSCGIVPMFPEPEEADKVFNKLRE